MNTYIILPLLLGLVACSGLTDEQWFDAYDLGCGSASSDGAAWGYLHGAACLAPDMRGTREIFMAPIDPNSEIDVAFQSGYLDCYGDAYDLGYTEGAQDYGC